MHFYFDGLGRLLYGKEETPQGVVFSGEQDYESLFRVRKKRAPYFEGNKIDKAILTSFTDGFGRYDEVNKRNIGKFRFDYRIEKLKQLKYKKAFCKKSFLEGFEIYKKCQTPKGCIIYHHTLKC